MTLFNEQLTSEIAKAKKQLKSKEIASVVGLSSVQYSSMKNLVYKEALELFVCIKLMQGELNHKVLCVGWKNTNTDLSNCTYKLIEQGRVVATVQFEELKLSNEELQTLKKCGVLFKKDNK